MRRHNVLFISTEVRPFGWVGGLGEVAASLPKNIDGSRFDVRTVMPLYTSIDEVYKQGMEKVADFVTALGGERRHCSLYTLVLDDHVHYFIRNSHYFDTEKVYGYEGDFECAAFFSKAILDAIPLMGDFFPHVIHCNEWQTALIPVYLKESYSDDPRYRGIQSILSLHNLGFQGIADACVIDDMLELSGTDAEKALLNNGMVNCLHAGILYADRVTVVSPTYAKEVSTEEFGMGLEHLFRDKPPLGILNGLDYEAYNPQTDPKIAERYCSDSIDNKLRNKTALQRKLGLPENPRSMFLLSLSRLTTYQKGIELIIDAIPEMMGEDIQLLILGSGEKKFVDRFREYETQYPDKIRHREFDFDMQQLALAGSDMLLMPSMYEPCGLSQIMAMRYGTIPLVRPVGGLKDTVVPYFVGCNYCTGFAFSETTSTGLLQTLKEALKAYHLQQRFWRTIVHNCMVVDYSWRSSAYVYGLVYSDLIFKQVRPTVHHDSFDSEFRTVQGACHPAQTVRLTISAIGADSVTLRTWNDDSKESLTEMRKEGDLFISDLIVPDKPGILWYYFIIHAGENTFFYGLENNSHDGVGALSMTVPHSFQITVSIPSTIPDWYRDGIIYQIYPDRFNRGADWRSRVSTIETKERDTSIESNIVEDWYEEPVHRERAESVKTWDFYGGTLDGIREKIPYLKSLGVTIVYINPIFKSVSNHRYDTADYMSIDPLLGDYESFDRLVEELNRNGMRLILDGVFNHTGYQSIYFDKDDNHSNGAYHNPDSPYRGWYHFHPGEGCGYECWWGEQNLPLLNHDDPSLIDFILGKDGVVRSWIRRGISGWRVDVAEEMSDDFIARLRTAAKKEMEDCVIVGEAMGDATRCTSAGKTKKLLLGNELDSVTNYPLRHVTIEYVMGDIDSKTFRARVFTLAQHYPDTALYGAINFIGCHDTERILTIFKKGFDDECAVKAMKMAVALIYVSPGIPCIYYGDEAGLEGGIDPGCRAGYPWGRENTDILEFYRRMNRMYSQNQVLSRGDLSIIDYKDLLVIRRSLGDAIVTAVFNNTDHDGVYDGYIGKVIDLYTGEPVEGDVVLGPLDFVLLLNLTDR